MSAYMVDRDHIRYLVDASLHLDTGRGGFYWFFAGEWRSIQAGDYERAAQIGQLLWDENRRSIEHRYPDTLEDWSNAPGPIDESFVYDEHKPLWHHAFQAIQVVKACHCYAYQACEHPEWKESEAKAWIAALEAVAVRNLPGYEQAEWGPPAEVVTA